MSAATSRNVKHRKIALGQLQRQSTGSDVRLSKSTTTQDKDKQHTPDITKNDDYDYLRKLTLNILYPDQEFNTDTSSILLPPLSSSNNLDQSIYALFALLLKNFVYSWYTEKLDLGARESFTKELVYLLAHISRELQSRITMYDDEIVKLITLDIPYVIIKHVKSIDIALYQTARDMETTNSVENERIFLERWCKCNAEELDDVSNMQTYRRILVDNVTSLILPHENLESQISKEFVVSLLDGVVLNSVINSFAENFVIWDILGKVCKALNQPKQEKKNLKDDKEEVSLIHRILAFFYVEKQYTMRKENYLSYSDYTPFLSLIGLFLRLDVRFPIFFSFFKVIFYWFLQVNMFKRFTSNTIKRNIFLAASSENISKAVCGLRHLMFPHDDIFDMKPRYIPQNEQELKLVYDQNLKYLMDFLTSKTRVSRFFLSDSEAENSDIVETRAKYLMNTFKHRIQNEILIQNLLDSFLSCLFPELKTPFL